MWAKNEVIRLQAAKLALLHQQQWSNSGGASADAASAAAAAACCNPTVALTSVGSLGVALPPHNHHMFGAGGTGVLPPPPCIQSDADDVIVRAKRILAQGFHLGL